MGMFCSKLKIFLFLSLSALLGFGQPLTEDVFTSFKNYTVRNGLPHNRINDIIQDNRGFIWFATENGLSRYDGYSFINFFTSNTNSLTLPGNIVTSLAVDNQDNIWVGTTQGLCRIALGNGKLQRYLTQPGNPNSPRTNHIRKLFFSEKSNALYIETLEGTLSIFNLTDEGWNHYSHVATSQPYYRYHTIFEDIDGDIWIGTRNTPILKFSANNSTFITFVAKGLERKSKRDNDLADIYQTVKGKWFVCGLDGIYEFFPNKNEFNRIHTSSTFSIAEDSTGIIWFGTGNGLLALDSKTNRVTRFQNNQNNPNSLINNHINKVFVDKANNIWIGTRNGVSLLTSKHSSFQYFYNIPGNETSLSSNHVTAIEQSKDGQVFIGTASHGINTWNPNDMSFNQVRERKSKKCSLTSDRISNLYIDRHGILWIGLWAGVGFNSYNPKTDCFTHYSLDPNSLKYDWYTDFLEDNDGNFLVGMWGASGTTFFDRKSKKFIPKNFLTYEKPRLHFVVSQITNDGRGSFFFQSNEPKRIFRYCETTKTYTSHVSQFTDLDISLFPGMTADLPFNFSMVWAVATNGYGHTIFATDMGLFSFEKEKGFQAVLQKSLNPSSIAVSDSLIYLISRNSFSTFCPQANIYHSSDIDADNPKHLSAMNDGYLVAIDSNKLVVLATKNGLLVNQRNITPSQPTDKFQHLISTNPL